MAVTNTTNTVQEAGNGVKVAFDFDFKVFQASDMEVFEIDQTTLIATEITSNFTVTINSITEGGTVTYDTAPASGKDSFLKRKLDLTQGTNVKTEGTIPANSLNNEYDRSRMIDIQQQEEIDRSIKFAETSSLTDVAFPESTSASARALKIPAWDAAGTALELINISSVVNTDPIAVQGDIVQGSSLGEAEKLAIGTSGQSSEVVAGKLAYVTQKTITDFTNATHDHADVAGGGNLGDIQATSITLTGTTDTDANTVTSLNIIAAHGSLDNSSGTPAWNGTQYNFTDSFTDNGVGDTEVFIQANLADANYTVLATADDTTSAIVVVANKTTNSFDLMAKSDSGVAIDRDISVAVIGGQ